MKDLQKMGGIAALYEAAAYVLGMMFFLLVDYAGVVDPVQKVALLVDNQAILYIMNLIIYLIFGVFLVVLALALYERLKAGSPAMMQTATAFGLIWAGLVIASGMVANIGTGVVVDLYGTDPAQAATVWLAIDSVVDGIGGGNEIVGGLWVLLVSWPALRTGELPRALELSWRGDRCGGHPHACSGSRRARGFGFWAGSNRVVRMAGDRYVAQ